MSGPSPNLNAHAGPLTATRDFVERYHAERNHQGLSNRIIRPGGCHLGTASAIERRQRLGGMLNYYYPQQASGRKEGLGTVSRGQLSKYRVNPLPALVR
ncbi:MAG: hypothetical protein EXQ52_04035 [Bryobacterales bacterium]|nr:hypothetical protein [Bryobacterales bacterium]